MTRTVCEYWLFFGKKLAPFEGDQVIECDGNQCDECKELNQFLSRND